MEVKVLLDIFWRCLDEMLEQHSQVTWNHDIYFLRSCCCRVKEICLNRIF